MPRAQSRPPFERCPPPSALHGRAPDGDRYHRLPLTTSYCSLSPLSLSPLSRAPSRARQNVRARTQAAERRREAILTIQRRQHALQLERKAAALRAREEALLARAAKRQAAVEARRQQEAELEAALAAGKEAGKEGKRARARAARALDLKRVAEGAETRMEMRFLGLLPALISPRSPSRKHGRTLHLEETAFDEARTWIDDGELDVP